MGIKEKYAIRKLKKTEAAIQRKPTIPDFDSIKRVGVIWQPEQKVAFHYLQEYFSKKQTIFRSLCIYNKDVEMAADSSSLIPKDLNWWGFPKPGKIDRFTEMHFDLLLNISMNQNVTIDYITLVTEAKFKIGWSPDEKNYFDLNINISKNQDALYLAKQQIFYLGELNKKQADESAFTGAGVALVTPFTKNNKVDFNALETVVANQVQGGMDYLVALGTTAETPTLTSEEKLDVVKLIKEKSSGLPVVVGMAGNDTRKLLKQIDKFDFEGVSGLLMVTPFYNKPSQEGMLSHFKEIAKACPAPIILYNVPSRTGINLEAETVAKLAEASDKIVAIKEASGILSQITKIGKYTPDNFTVISGDDVLALPIISIGGKGVISVIANALPGKLSQLIHLALDGRFNDSLEVHFELIDLFKLIFKEGNPGGIKALMHYQGIIENELRSPLFKNTDETYNEIKEAYLKLKF